jgi:hypothetical protein
MPSKLNIKQRDQKKVKEIGGRLLPDGKTWTIPDEIQDINPFAKWLPSKEGHIVPLLQLPWKRQRRQESFSYLKPLTQIIRRKKLLPVFLSNTLQFLLQLLGHRSRRNKLAKRRRAPNLLKKGLQAGRNDDAPEVRHLLGLILEAMNQAALWNAGKGSLPGGVVAQFGLQFDLSVQYMEGFLEAGMRMRSGTTTRRDQHIDHGIGPIRVLTRYHRAIRVSDYCQTGPLRRSDDLCCFF